MEQNKIHYFYNPDWDDRRMLFSGEIDKNNSKVVEIILKNRTIFCFVSIFKIQKKTIKEICKMTKYIKKFLA